jgi:hypothetical protein
MTRITQYGYDTIDQLVAVTDPRALVTGYTVDGLVNLTLQSSPDTGGMTPLSRTLTQGRTGLLALIRT